MNLLSLEQQIRTLELRVQNLEVLERRVKTLERFVNESKLKEHFPVLESPTEYVKVPIELFNRAVAYIDPSSYVSDTGQELAAELRKIRETAPAEAKEA